MNLTRRIATAAIGGGMIAGAFLGAGHAAASPWTDAIDSQTNTKYAYGPYTSHQCATVLMQHPALAAAHQANPSAGSPGACISKDNGRSYYLYTNVALG